MNQSEDIDNKNVPVPAGSFLHDCQSSHMIDECKTHHFENRPFAFKLHAVNRFEQSNAFSCKRGNCCLRKRHTTTPLTTWKRRHSRNRNRNSQIGNSSNYFKRLKHPDCQCTLSACLKSATRPLQSTVYQVAPCVDWSSTRSIDLKAAARKVLDHTWSSWISGKSNLV